MSLDRVMQILASHGIRMRVWGNGCSGSPEVRFDYKGETLVENYDCSFDMFKEEPAEAIALLSSVQFS